MSATAMAKEKRGDPFAKLVAGWGCLNFPPQNEEAWALLANTLRQVAGNESHAKRIRDSWALQYDHCPKPREVVEFASGIPVDLEASLSMMDGCLQCAPYGGNFKLVQRNGMEGMGRCDCERGRVLAAIDKAKVKKAEEAKKRKGRESAASAPPPLLDGAMAAANDREVDDNLWGD